MLQKDKLDIIESARHMLDEEMSLRHFTEATKRSYRSVVAAFLRTVNKPLSELCSEDLRGYLLASKKRGLSWSSMNQQQCAIRLFIGSCLGWKPEDMGLPPRKSEKRVNFVLSASGIHQIINSARPGLEQTLLLFIYATGARSFEAVRLHVSDIQSARMLVRISQGKGRKDRLVPLSLQLLQTLREYYKLNRPGEWLFPSEDQSEPMKVAEVRTIWNLAKRKAGIAAGGVHSLRHAFATNMLEQGVDLYSLQQILGHSNIQSTARYLSMTNTISRAVGDKIDVLLKAVTPSA